MKKRTVLVEHPFGTLKYRAGINHFLMRGVEKYRAEFSLMVLAYNFTRVLTILCVDKLRNIVSSVQLWVKNAWNGLKTGLFNPVFVCLLGGYIRKIPSSSTIFHAMCFCLRGYFGYFHSLYR
jgi:hypothetical protein